MNNQSKRATWSGGSNAIGTSASANWALTPPHSPNSNNQQHSSSGGNWRDRNNESWRSDTSPPQSSNWRQSSSVWNSADYSWSATPRIPTPPGFSARPAWNQQRDSWDAVPGISSRDGFQRDFGQFSREQQFNQQVPIPSWDTKPIASNMYNPRGKYLRLISRCSRSRRPSRMGSASSSYSYSASSSASAVSSAVSASMAVSNSSATSPCMGH